MSLLIALGETLETPFRILDEFDVFLDAETRKLVIQSLIHVATTLKHRQFIFITPQDLSSITATDQVKILKLNPPDRHQNAGGPTQQTLPFASQN
jgi:structural maintenance of chromosomes protein 6